jgi:hypothetical protein
LLQETRDSAKPDQAQSARIVGEKAMAKKSVEELIGRALTDKEFRDRLLASPEATLDAEGYDVAPEVIEAIKSSNPDEVNAVAQGLENQLANRKAAT